MGEILALIGKIIITIANGVNAIEATMQIAKESGVSFATLWRHLPQNWK